MTTLQIGFIVAASGIIAFWLIFAPRKPPMVDKSEVMVVLRYRSTLRVAALILAWIPPAAMIYVVARFVWRSDEMLIAAAVSFLATSIIAGLLLIEAERVQIVVTEKGITRSSPWTGRASLAWGEIKRVEYSNLNRWFVVIGDGRTIRVSRYLAGIADFVKVARARVAAERYVNVVTVMNELAPMS